MKTVHLGIEIGGTKLQVVAGDRIGRIIDRRRAAVPPGAGRDAILHHLEPMLTDLSRAHPVAGAGVGFGGPVDWRSGKILCSHQIEGWADFALARWVADRISGGGPVRIDNDANVGGLGETYCGGGVGADSLFYVTLGSGVGGGFITGGSIFHGDLPGESEIGHIRLDRSGTTVESRCSGWAVDARIRHAAARDPDSFLGEKLAASAVPGGEARWLSPAMASGDATAETILDETCADIAFALSHVTHLFHPQRILLGGGLSLIGEPLRSGVQRHLRRWLMDVFAPGPAVSLAALGEDAVPVGALILAAEAS